MDITYDTNSRVTTSKLSSDTGTAFALTQTSYDALGRPQCVATRMNIALYGSLPASACSPGAEGSHGPDRLTRLYYDAVGRHNKTLVAYQVDGEETYEVQKGYSPNGQLRYLFDAHDNRTTYTYDGHDRLAKINYPVAVKPPGENPEQHYRLRAIHLRRQRQHHQPRCCAAGRPSPSPMTISTVRRSRICRAASPTSLTSTTISAG